MKKTIQNVFAVIGVISAIAGILGYLYQIKSNNPKLEIVEISNDNLTNLPKIKNLKSNFYYKDSLIDNLWKLNTYVENIGDKTIIGKGANKNLIDMYLTFRLNKGFKLIDFTINSSDFPYSIDKINDSVCLSFSQWRESEKLIITIYAEQVSKDLEELKLIMNEREIIDGDISYRSLDQQIKHTKSLVSHFPKGLAKVLFWFGIVFYGLFILLMPIGLIVELKKVIKYKRWKKEWLNIFKEKMPKFREEEGIIVDYTYKTLPYHYWKKIEIPAPEIPSNSAASLIFAVGFVLILLLIPLLWMIEV